MRHSLFRERSREAASARYVRLEETAGRPAMEFGVGDRKELKAAGLEYETEFDVNSPYVLIQLSAVNSSLSGIAKVYGPADHEGVTKAWLGYVTQVQSDLIDCMKSQQPGAEINGLVTLVNTQDNVILNRLRLDASAKEITHYKVLEEVK